MFNMPSDSKWEFAARGGHGSPGNFTFSGSNVATEVAWHAANTGTTGTGFRGHEVGMLMPNALGLYDMSGNIREWVWDLYGTYPSVAQTNPEGVSSGISRVRRGGQFSSSFEDVRSASRVRVVPYHRTWGVGAGFRLVRP